jgi:hypothetical protein
MQEVYREYFLVDGKVFLIVIFKDEEGYELRIFFDKKVIHQFSFMITEDVYHGMLQYSPVNPFDEMIGKVKEWIIENASKF